MIPLKRLAPFTLAVAALAIGCSKDSNGPNDVDPAVMEQAVGDVAAQFTGNAVFQSLAQLSGRFTLTAAAQARLQAALPFAPRADRANLAQAARSRLNAMRLYASLAPRSPAALFPANVLGKTFVWDEALDKYSVSARTGAPANGVRFILYTVDQLNGMPVETPSLQELGQVDLTDESTPAADILGVLVKFGSQTVADYNITAVTTTSSLELTASGSLFGQSDQVDFTLANVATQSGQNFDVDIDYHVESTNGFAIDFVIGETATSATALTVTLDFRVAGGGNSIQMVGSIAISGQVATINIQIKYNNTVVATITGDASNPTITGANGRQLTEREINALFNIFDEASNVVEQLGAVFGPGYLLF